MSAKKITYEDKVAINPPGVRKNQVWDLDLNEIKEVAENHANLLDALILLIPTLGTEYNNLFTYTSGSQVISIPANVKITNIILGEGRVLKKSIDWVRTIPTEITIIYALEANDTIYITGIN